MIEKLLKLKIIDVEDVFEAFGNPSYIEFSLIAPYLEELTQKGLLFDFNEYQNDADAVIIDVDDRLKVIPSSKYFFGITLTEKLEEYCEKANKNLSKEWLRRRIPLKLKEIKDFDIYNEEITHVIDFLNSSDSRSVSETLLSRDYNNLVEESILWTKKLAKNSQIRPDDEFNIVVHSFLDYTWVRLNSLNALDHESDIMGHCIGQGSYDSTLASGECNFYSLRDRSGESHVTIELSGGMISQIQGKVNERVVDKYVPIVEDFIKNYLNYDMDFMLTHSNYLKLGYKSHSIDKELPPFYYNEYLSTISADELKTLSTKGTLSPDFIQEFKNNHPDWDSLNLNKLNKLIDLKNKIYYDGSVAPVTRFKTKNFDNKLNFILKENEVLFNRIGLELDIDVDHEQTKSNILEYINNERHISNRKSGQFNKKEYYRFLNSLRIQCQDKKDSEDYILTLIKEDNKYGLNVFDYDGQYEKIKELFIDIKTKHEANIKHTEIIDKEYNGGNNRYARKNGRSLSLAIDSVDECEACNNEDKYKEQLALVSDIESEVSPLISKEINSILGSISSGLEYYADMFRIIDETLKSFMIIGVMANNKNLDANVFIKQYIEENLDVTDLLNDLKKSIAELNYDSGFLVKNVAITDAVFKAYNKNIKNIESYIDEYQKISGETCGSCNGEDIIDDNNKLVSENIFEDIELELICSSFHSLADNCEDYLLNIDSIWQNFMEGVISDYSDF